jgi:hypothetical protein
MHKASHGSVHANIPRARVSFNESENSTAEHYLQGMIHQLQPWTCLLSKIAGNMYMYVPRLQQWISQDRSNPFQSTGTKTDD